MIFNDVLDNVWASYNQRKEVTGIFKMDSISDIP